MTEKKSFGITSNALKIFACACMLCDHVGLVLVDNNSVMRAIGRVAFPIFVFLLVEGYRHTSNVKKYILRLFVFAIISEVPFDLAFTGNVFDLRYQNVFFTLTAGLIVIYLLDIVLKEMNIASNISGRNDVDITNEHNIENASYRLFGKYRCFIFFVMIIALAVISELLNFDYGMGGIIIIVLFFIFPPAHGKEARELKIKRNVENTILSAIIYYLFYGPSELYAVLSIIPISFYNGGRGVKNKAVQYAFYAFYPVHLLCIYFCSSLMKI